MMNEHRQGPVGADYLATHPAAHEDLFDWHKLTRTALFALRSIRRRLLLFAAVVAGMVGLAVVAIKTLPKTYTVESRVLVQQNAVLATRADSGADAPRTAPDLILGADNLHTLIEMTHLIDEWPKRRAPLLRLKDRIMGALGPPPTRAEMMLNLTGLLEKNLLVWANADGTIGLRLTWPDAQLCYQIVDAAEQNFLEKRYVLEVSTIAERISILERHALELKKEIDAELEQVRTLRARYAPKGGRAPAAAPSRKAADPEAVNLRVQLEVKQRAISDLEQMRDRHLMELQNRLTEMRSVYAPNHPAVVDLEESIKSLKGESPQIAALRAEESELRKRLAGKVGDEQTGLADPVIPADLFRADATEDPAVEYARARLRFALQQYASIRDQINAARVDMDTAQAAFKYRYSVVLPPEIPRGPTKPKASQVLIAALLAGLLLGLLATTLTDLHAGTVLEKWQLEDLLRPSAPIVTVHTSWPRGELPARWSR